MGIETWMEVAVLAIVVVGILAALYILLGVFGLAVWTWFARRFFGKGPGNR